MTAHPADFPPRPEEGREAKRRARLPRGAALAGSLYVVAAVVGALALVAAAVPAPQVESFWPVSVVSWLTFLGFVGAAFREMYRWWRRTQAPAVKAETAWREALETRLSTCEAAQKQQAETTGAIREMREALAALKETVREADRAIRVRDRDLARLQGAFEHWDGQTERRHLPSDRRHHPDEP